MLCNINISRGISSFVYPRNIPNGRIILPFSGRALNVAELNMAQVDSNHQEIFFDGDLVEECDSTNVIPCKNTVDTDIAPEISRTMAHLLASGGVGDGLALTQAAASAQSIDEESIMKAAEQYGLLGDEEEEFADEDGDFAVDEDEDVIDRAENDVNIDVANSVDVERTERREAIQDDSIQGFFEHKGSNGFFDDVKSRASGGLTGFNVFQLCVSIRRRRRQCRILCCAASVVGPCNIVR